MQWIIFRAFLFEDGDDVCDVPLQTCYTAVLARVRAALIVMFRTMRTKAFRIFSFAPFLLFDWFLYRLFFHDNRLFFAFLRPNGYMNRVGNA
ncbi:hypothetical protein [Dubosiella newyorkensis]|uniref:hypothetical protein n=1 Tax=Dubosiella newyorkensis TaxID=1862672 RepID=UPI0025A5C783|nr:hypothetical protein [Dubosiella newyorkensis]